MTSGDGAVSLRSKSKRWLPETLVTMPTNVDNATPTVSPNPADNTVQVTIKNGKYHLRVLNTVGQTIFEQNTEGSLSVDVSKWTNGIYLFEVTDKATNKRQRSKIVVQH
jgi:Secretion system C-terminal sorting domain